MVSPVDKSGGVGGVAPLGSLSLQFALPLQSSPGGDAITYDGEDFYEPQLGSLNQYVSTRGPAGWSTQNVTAPGPPGKSQLVNLYTGFSPDLAEGVVRTSLALPGSEGAPPGYLDLYLHQSGGANYRPLITALPPHLTAEEFGVRFDGGNSGTSIAPAFSHIIFSANDALTPDATYRSGESNLYDWANGQLRAVNVLPGAAESEPNASFGVDYGEEVNGVEFPSLDNAISADGSLIFWTDKNNGNLYVREDGTRTVQVDASVGGGGQFQTASTDGLKVFFTKGDLYEFDTSDGSTTDLAPGGEVQGVVGASDSGSYVYFVARAKLASNENANKEKAEKGNDNLYLRHGGITSFIAALAPQDDEINAKGFGPAEEGDWRQTWAGRTARVSPSGRYLGFDSIAHLTEYNGLGNDEVYLYDANSDQLHCVSCNPGVTPPAGSTFLPVPATVGGIYQPRYLNDDGQVFFDTPNALVPPDTNGKMDVYEYESGKAYLISTGTSEDESTFADASESGEDVFFTTRQQLVPQDQDQIIDLYDARVNGGFQATEAVAQCSGEACLRAPGEPPVSPSLITSTTGVSGNLVSAAKTLAKSKPKKPKTRRRSKRKSAKRRTHSKAKRTIRGRR